MNNPIPDENTSTILEDLARLYQRTHLELDRLVCCHPDADDLTPSAQAVRVSIEDYRRILRALAIALAGRRPLRLDRR